MSDRTAPTTLLDVATTAASVTVLSDDIYSLLVNDYDHERPPHEALAKAEAIQALAARLVGEVRAAVFCGAAVAGRA
jgi:hypothetical protein